MSKRHRRVIVVGLDGACWDLIEPWVLASDLPVIRGLRDEGAWGPLESTIPPITCPAWKCYSTGKNPGKLGVFWWQHVDMSARRVMTPTSESFRSAELWDYLNRVGLRTGVMGMPTTYPPRDIVGFMISGGPDSASRGYTRPTGLEGILRSWGYRVHPPIEGSLQEGSPLVNHILDWIDLQFAVAERLLARESVEFLQLTIFYLNWLQHYFYNRDPVREAWVRIDRWIGKLANDFDHVVLMSDHGTAPMRKIFFLNAWLEQNGYLRTTRRRPVAERLYRFGITKERASEFARALRLGNLASRSDVLRSLARRFLLDEEGLMSDRSGDAALAGVDWERTLAVALPQGPIYVNRDVVRDRLEYEALRNQLIEGIEAIEDPDGGRPIAKVYRREDVYHGQHVNEAPDLIALDAEEYHNRGGLGKRALFQESDWAGNNARYGMFLVRGPRVRRGFRFSEMKIYDLAPTLLNLMGASIPNDMDGVVAQELLEA
jgi:predicted AlkP superfamily phosphohydrolase/phosphomutase